jgi:putative membrane protein
MPNFLVTWLVSALALLLTAQFVPGITLASFTAAIVAAAILGFINAEVRPILFILTLPLTVITLGLFLPLLNVIALSLAAAWMGDDFTIANPLAALVGAIVLAIISGILNSLTGNDDNNNDS